MNLPNRTLLRKNVLIALGRLRAEFPLEARMATADTATRRAYAEILRHWLRGAPPRLDLLALGTRATLIELDAIVADDHGVGCYPFSARDTGIKVHLTAGVVTAMCAVDALAIARLAGKPTHIDAHCYGCGATIRLRMEGDGSLDHDQIGLARVTWLTAHELGSSCSEGLCRNLCFLCPACPLPAGSDGFTLPQAAALGNAFFGFQRTLLQDLAEKET